jgi:hypothetical protein
MPKKPAWICGGIELVGAMLLAIMELIDQRIVLAGARHYLRRQLPSYLELIVL